MKQRVQGLRKPVSVVIDRLGLSTIVTATATGALGHPRTVTVYAKRHNRSYIMRLDRLRLAAGRAYYVPAWYAVSYAEAEMLIRVIQHLNGDDPHPVRLHDDGSWDDDWDRIERLVCQSLP